MKKSFYVLLLLILSGCGIYSTSGTGRAGGGTIAVPLFENSTVEFGINEVLTDTLIVALVKEASLKVVDEDQADLVVRGRVTSVREEPFTYGQTQTDQNRIIVTLDVSCYDTKKGRTVWEEKGLSGYGIYRAGGRQEEERNAGIHAAFAMLVKDIVDRTAVGGW
ncbi:MAG: hypothetical protein EXS64_19465 [Candidatus Latescibacteria bacterium]|nr:hypothetical protein [Candidatus Latescibacterota bacterium]